MKMVVGKLCARDFLWRWDNSLDLIARENLTAAIQANCRYAEFCAWGHLNDASLAVDLLEDAVTTVQASIQREAAPPDVAKLRARLRRQIARIAKQRSRRKRHEESTSDFATLDLRIADWDPTDRILIEELFHLLSPQGQDVLKARYEERSWREIGKAYGIDYRIVKTSFERETNAALAKLRYHLYADR